MSAIEDLVTTLPTATGHGDGKRKAGGDEADADRIVKRRASRACKACRDRKVRCDVTVSGGRCSGCRLDDIECVVLASRRGRGGRPEATVEIAEVYTGPGASATHAEKTDGMRLENPEEAPTQLPVSVTFEEEPEKARHDAPNVEEGTGQTFLSSESVMASSALPLFIKKLPDRVDGDDLDFLTRKGALMVPAPDLQLKILNSYVQAVHPFMPMLDLNNFRRAIFDEQGATKVSLLLFQAVMFAGLQSLDTETVHRLSFSTVKEAREVFFNRVRLLYEFEVERDSSAILQALILMSFYYGKWDERKHTWHWTGLAYDLARNMGLHREPTLRFTKPIQRLRRRFWWSLYIRDRLIALGTRRPMRIRDDEFDVSPLRLDDFDYELELEGLSMSLTKEERTSLAHMCVQLSTLCKCIGHVVGSQYTILNKHPDVPFTMMVVSKRSVADTESIERCDGELDEWHRGLIECTKLATGATTSVKVHMAMLDIIYQNTRNVLHRAQALQPQPESSRDRAIQKASRSKIKSTARSLTASLQAMLQKGHLGYLSPVGVTALNAASLSHILDLKSDDEDVRDASAFRLTQTLQVLQALGKIYASADAAISFLTAITRKAGVSIPIAEEVGRSTDAHRKVTGDGEPADRPTDRLIPHLDRPSQHDNVDSWPQISRNGTTIYPTQTAMVGYNVDPLATQSEQYPIDNGKRASNTSAFTHGAFFGWDNMADSGIELDFMELNPDFYLDNY